MRVSVRHYVDTLLELHRTRNLRVFVHPVPPVLDATRANVTKFNRLLEDALAAHRSWCVWLGFFPDLLRKDALADEFRLDGTHLHPAYVRLLTAALEENSWFPEDARAAPAAVDGAQSERRAPLAPAPAPAPAP
jgi:hypothetical protein